MRRLGGRGGPRAAVVGALLVVAAVAAPDPPVAAPVPIPSESVADADESPRAPFALGHVVVKFRTELAAEEADALLAEEALGPRRSIGRTGADVVSVPRGHERDAIARLRARAGVAFAEPDYVVHAASLVAPTDPLAASQWAMATIGMPDAWSYSVGNGVLVAVIDTGIDMTHEDLSSQWTYSPADGNPAHHVLLSAPDPSCVPVSQPVDDNGHGTHVAGTIAAASTLSGSGAVGVAGMAPGARILPLKALDCKAHGLATDVATAIEIAAQGGAQVINLSLGLPGSCISSPIQTAIEEAIGAGSFVVAEVGNDGNATTEVPAACGGAFGVAATTPDDAHASFSNTNGTVMLSAPGVDILSTYNGSNSDYASMSGTSMAAAHVSGCGALLKSVDGGLGPAQLAQLLESAAVDLGDPGRDDLFGAGRLDCGRAVASAAGAAPTPGPTSTRTPTPTTTPSPTGTSAPAPTASPTDTPIAANPASATTVATALSPSGTPAGSTATITPTVAVIPSPTATFGAVASATPSLVPSPTLTPTSNVAPATATPTNALAVSATATFGVATPTPTPAPTITTNAVPSPTPSQTPSGSGTPSAALPTPTATVGSVNCSGFATWAEAQAFFLAHGGPTQDPFGLDGDHDGIACESLPGAPGNAATATALAQTPPASPAASPSSTPSPGGTPSPSPSPTLLASGTPTATAVAAPSPAPGADRFEDNSSAMSYSSSSAWAQVLDGAASAGHYRRSSQVASSAAFTVTGGDGTLVRWGAVRGPTSGNADVSLDGAFVATVDLYAPATTFGPVAAYAIPSGRHSLRITVRGDRNPSSGGSDVGIDYFDVLNPIGGRGFSMERDPGSVFAQNIALGWERGTAQRGYWVMRLSASGAALLPPGTTPLSAAATSFTDALIVSDPAYCYALLPLDDNLAPIGNSDVLCTLGSLRSGSPPTAFRIQLNQSSTATLSWGAAQSSFGADYLLLALNSRGLRTTTLPSGATGATDDTGGELTCYALFAVLGGQVVGSTDVLCGVPGAAHL